MGPKRCPSASVTSSRQRRVEAVDQESTTTTSHSDRLLTVAEFASRIGVSPYTVRKWIKKSQLPAVDLNVGGKLRVYRIPEAQIEAISGRIKITDDNGEDGRVSDQVSGGVPCRLEQLKTGPES